MRWHKFLNNIKKACREAMIIKIVDANDNLVYVPLIKSQSKLKEVLWKHQFLIKSFKPKLGNLKIFKEYQRKYRKIKKELK